MLGPLEGLCQIILEHMFRLCCWRVPNTHEMSIKPVRAARTTDTRHHPCLHLSTGFDRGSTGGRAGVGRGSTKRVGGRGGERIQPSVTNRRPPARTRARGRRPDFRLSQRWKTLLFFVPFLLTGHHARPGLGLDHRHRTARREGQPAEQRGDRAVPRVVCVTLVFWVAEKRCGGWGWMLTAMLTGIASTNS